MDLEIKGKRALVCAASQGLGYATAAALAAEGCDLFLCSRRDAEIKDVAQTLKKEFGVNVVAEAFDLTDSKAIPAFAQRVEETFGAIDILVNNVGGPPPSSAEETEHQAWVNGFDRVFLSATLMSQEWVKRMKVKGFGRIITITSLSVLEPIDNLVVSTSMRSAVTAFHKTLSREVAQHGITVNSVMPGVIHTKRIEQLREAKAKRLGTTLKEEISKTEEAIPAKRLGRPEELGALVAFLSSPKASYLNGLNIPVDGGLKKSI